MILDGTGSPEVWRSPLVDAPSESLQRDVVPRLEEQRLRTIERRIDLELAVSPS